MKDRIRAWAGVLHALDRKLVRDAMRVWGQLLAAALVMAAGVSVLVMAQFLHSTLTVTQAAYYERYAFADVFAGARRAPLWLMDDIRAIPGVRTAEARIVSQARLDIPDLIEPARATLVSLPRFGDPALNRLVISAGGLPDPARHDEIVLSKEFADAHELEPGDAITAVLNGRMRELRVAAIAQSPEFIYVISPGEIVPDPERMAVAWMRRDALENAFDLEGAFTSLVARLGPEANEDAVIDRIDRLLDPYGGAGAYTREDQLSHAFLDSEIQELESTGRTLPPIFLIVSAFMLYVMLTRLIETEREQIGLLKAFGYSNADVALHYMKFALIVGVAGGLMGAGFGLWAGHALSSVYTDYFSLPFMTLGSPGASVAIGVIVAVSTACAGSYFAARRALGLEPAVAMRPPAPARYRRGIADRLGVARFLTVPSRIIARNIERRPIRAFLTALGIAAGCSTIIGTTFMIDAVDDALDKQFYLSQRQDLTLTFGYERDDSILHEIARLPGVIKAEGARAVPVEAIHGPRTERTALQSLSPPEGLTRALDVHANAIAPPPDGIVMSRYLAEELGVDQGDAITLRVLDGRRPVLTLPLVRLVEDYVGSAIYMSRDALNRALGEGPVITSAAVTIDSMRREEFYTAVKASPLIQGVSAKTQAIEEIQSTMDEIIIVYTLVLSLFAGSICFGVVYNAARIALSERGRELASLRVLGFTKDEVAYVLLGELGLLTLVALPLGCVLGFGLANVVVTFYNAELFRPPLLVTSSRYASAILYTVGFATFSGWIVRRRIKNLDLIEVLKTRE